MVDLSIVMWKFTRGYQWLHHLGSSSNGPSQGLARRMSSLNLVAIVITHGHRPGRIKNDPFPSIVRVSSNLLNIIVHQPEILVISGFIYSHLCAAEWTAFVGMILHENKSHLLIKLRVCLSSPQPILGLVGYKYQGHCHELGGNEGGKNQQWWAKWQYIACCADPWRVQQASGIPHWSNPWIILPCNTHLS